MKSIYSILLGIGFVIGLCFMVNLVIWDNLWVTTDLFLVMLLAGGYITTYSSNIGKSQVALISGMRVSIILIIYQLFINKTSSTSEVSLISFLIIPGFFMLIGGFVAKNTKVKMTNLLNSLSQSKSKFG